MHILFIGYGKTSQRVAKQLFDLDYQLTTISQTPKNDLYADHLVQNIHEIDLQSIKPIDVAYILLAPRESGIEAYQKTYLDSAQPIIQALQHHPIKKVIIVSSTRVYGENHGEIILDESEIRPNDLQGEILYAMEKVYLTAFPLKCSVVRATGIYGTSVSRMVKLAKNTQAYPNIHWSNRIHIDDLARFLVHLLHVEYVENTYICSNAQPIPLHEIIQWFQRKLKLSELNLLSAEESGKKILAERMLASGFKLQHQDCFQDYAMLLEAMD